MSLKERLAQYEAVAKGGNSADTASVVSRQTSDDPPMALPGLASGKIPRSLSDQSSAQSSAQSHNNSMDLKERMMFLSANGDPCGGGSGFATASIGATIAASAKGFQESNKSGKISVRQVAKEAGKHHVSMPSYDELVARSKKAPVNKVADVADVTDASKGAATAKLGHEIASQIARSEGKRISVKSIVNEMHSKQTQSEVIPSKLSGTDNQETVKDLEAANANLAQRITSLQTDIAEETAKALESDEWVLKLTRELESLTTK